MKSKPLVKTLVVISSLVIIAFFFVALTQTDHSTMDHSQHRVNHDAADSSFAERERMVMPFDLSATLHIFEDTATGGVQRVVANDPGDTENIGLIREHLRAEAELFARGDFGDPSFLHGADMPGLAELEAAGEAGLLEVSYQDLPVGGQITYSSDDLPTVIALHLWFQAQVIDHGEHATN